MVSMEHRSVVLRLALEAAVPLWIERLRGLSWEEIQERARVCAQVVAAKGDVIQFRGSRRGETAEAFNRLAEGLACAAFAPGGVRFMGLHFDAERTEVPG
jgi:hypothetical protein